MLNAKHGNFFQKIIQSVFVLEKPRHDVTQSQKFSHEKFLWNLRHDGGHSDKVQILEGIIERSGKSFITVGNALLTIRDRKLYREHFNPHPVRRPGASVVERLYLFP